jgi:hypothetical protein
LSLECVEIKYFNLLIKDPLWRRLSSTSSTSNLIGM